MMMVAADVVVEIADGKNRNWYFLPLGRRVRGNFDVLRVRGEIGSLRNRFQQPIPGQRIGLDLKHRRGFLIEPLHDPEHAAVREEIEKAHRIAPAVQEFDDIDVPTWVYWLRQGVEQGFAEVVQGKLPKIEGPVRTRFHSSPQPDATERLTAAIERQNELIERLLERLIDR